MKKIILPFIFLTLFALASKADPAKKVNLIYKSDTLSIEIVHPVKNANDHYIDLIIVLIDDKEFKTYKPKKQTNINAELMKIVIPKLKKGSEIVVKTRCNQFGNKNGSLDVQ
ncbi:MAG: hypothetical protein IPO21_04110 [Bacteroidales bacterium]|nr:hypothetical protein [Bacteroidales bacterium]